MTIDTYKVREALEACRAARASDPMAEGFRFAPWLVLFEAIAEVMLQGAEAEAETVSPQGAQSGKVDGRLLLVGELGTEVALRAAYLAYRRWQPDGDGETFLSYVTDAVRIDDLARPSTALGEDAPPTGIGACAGCGRSDVPYGGVARRGGWVCIECKDSR